MDKININYYSIKKTGMLSNGRQSIRIVIDYAEDQFIVDRIEKAVRKEMEENKFPSIISHILNAIKTYEAK